MLKKKLEKVASATKAGIKKIKTAVKNFKPKTKDEDQRQFVDPLTYRRSIKNFEKTHKKP